MPLLNSIVTRRTLGFMLAGMAVLLAVVATSAWLASRTQDNAQEVTRAREIRTLSSNVLTQLLDAETGQRGFLLTDDPRYLVPYDEAKPRLSTTLDRLRALVGSDQNASGPVERIRALVDAKLAELGETIELVKAGRREAALDIVRSDRGRQIMEETRGVLGQLIAQAEAEVAKRLADLKSGATTLVTATVAGGALIMIFAAAAFWTVMRYTRELVDARREVEALNVGLEERVAERTSELSRANDEIQRFAYIVSHDLRAPLVNIMGFTSELEIGTGTLKQFVAASDSNPELAEAARTAANEDLPEAVSFIRASTAKMDRLINAILRLSREGRRDLSSERIDLGKLFDATVASVQHQVEAAGARIELATRFPVIKSDRVALEQVFGNLLDNAVKYLSTDRPGLISVRADETRDRVRVTVTDNGRGISEQDHERIFELFRRSGAQDQPGEGIGLAHVRALVRRLGGEITIRSRLGEGAAFQVSLPKTLRPRNESVT
jgi:signal transduction histidine kinase